VRSGDTLWTISQRYNIVMRDIVLENNLAPPFKLQPGQRLLLPAPREYRVRVGDSVSSVARLFDVSASEVVRINDLEAPYTLSQGQVLRLPSPVTPQPKPAAIASRPASVPKPAVKDVQPAQEKPVIVADAGVPTPDKKPAVSSNPVKKKPKGKIKVQTPKRASSKFLKPVEGKVVSSYGGKKDGSYNDGINIKAPRGTPVKAADNGVVVYAGNGLKGSGNLILVRHDNRWMTAYGHLDTIKVANGDVISRGSKIGTVGSTGAVRDPQLHFEVRRGTKALNPKPYLE
jgi:murein DD-endopeptidase MepM/ murein hydrolase activator NlpD